MKALLVVLLIAGPFFPAAAACRVSYIVDGGPRWVELDDGARWNMTGSIKGWAVGDRVLACSGTRGGFVRNLTADEEKEAGDRRFSQFLQEQVMIDLLFRSFQSGN